MKKNQQKSPPAYDFPYDVLENILSRLPVKSLLRFKTVCRSWNATIKDPGFVKVHSNQLNILNSQCFYARDLRGPGDDTYSLIKFQGQEFYMESVVKFLSTEYKYANFLCCCEGILVFKRGNKFVLFNPFTRNHLSFSCPYDDIIHASYPAVDYGLCFDKYEDDYKFVIVFTEGKYLVYSIKNDRWAERRSEFRGSVYVPGTYVDGVVYWTMLIDASVWSKAIIYFDPRDDLLKKLHKPEDLKQERRFDLTNLRGNLCLYTLIESMIGIWSLEEDHGRRKRWTKLTTADNSESPVEGESDQVFGARRPMHLTSKSEVVFINASGTSYAVYCPAKQKFGEVKDFPDSSKMIMFPCLESLHFPAPRREQCSLHLDQKTFI